MGTGSETKHRMSFQPVFATIYWQLGINLNMTLLDPNGRPQYLLDDREQIEELIWRGQISRRLVWPLEEGSLIA